ncbi:nucleotide sugar dehydrogenase [Stappia sp. GBMRC 2046]|uniref:Nucleotide sugar dehydrogenase n=1 Tax=Stappia sediminis TaxID=2692190 RepID=A0A7X3LYJ6_9HYPH|nr:nucleotide sugar dehydrogenase [Stappia sediminis]MXN67467.1 nucleotide sugar dehydrogenase [Stappia sediminis]
MSIETSPLSERIAIVGLGYVGLPVAIAFAKVAEHAVGFDISRPRVEELKAGYDQTGEISKVDLLETRLHLSSDPECLAGASMYILTVPTPVDDAHRPDFTPLLSACEMVGPHLRQGAVVVVESTVYPGATEEVCGPALEQASGMECGTDFFLGYSPERINPGDREHRLETITKVVSGQDDATLERVASAYGAIVEAGVHKASSIRVAEAAKVIENTQRDINIALMNELSMIFERLDIPTREVLAAAGTKWNFLKFFPGLVGGHCIGVDPYYLTAKAEQVGYQPEVILAGRRINDGMGRFLARKTIKLMVSAGRSLTGARIGVLGLAFKEDVPDLRNSKVPDVIDELRSFGLAPILHDPHCNAEEVRHEFGLTLDDLSCFTGLDALILAVPHRAYLDRKAEITAMLAEGGVLIDLKGALPDADVPAGILRWCL